MRSDKDAFCVVIPPPNVTGVLHMGHALDDTLQDILIRYNRMQGKKGSLAAGDGSCRYCNPDGG